MHGAALENAINLNNVPYMAAEAAKQRPRADTESEPNPTGRSPCGSGATRGDGCSGKDRLGDAAGGGGGQLRSGTNVQARPPVGQMT